MAVMWASQHMKDVYTVLVRGPKYNSKVLGWQRLHLGWLQCCRLCSDLSGHGLMCNSLVACVVTSGLSNACRAICRHSATPQGKASPLHVPVYQREGSPALAALAKSRSSQQTFWKQVRPQYSYLQPYLTQRVIHLEQSAENLSLECQRHGHSTSGTCTGT